MAEQIDSTQWLPRDASIVKPERVAKGDMEVVIRDGRIAAASVPDNTLLAYLIEREILEQHHAYYAMVFMDLRAAFRRRTEYYSNPVYASEFFGSDTSNGVFETIYLRVVRLIMGKPEKAINYVCHEPATRENVRAAYTARHDCRDAFDRLVSAIDEVREQFDNAPA